MKTSKQGVRTWYVVRIDRDNRDTHAGETLQDALEHASPEDESTVEWGTVEARDAGAARLMRPATWTAIPSTEGGAS